MVLLFALSIYAQEMDAGEEPSEPEQVIKLEEIKIELEPIKVFTIPRMEGDLPPVDFIGVFREWIRVPDCNVLALNPQDLEALKIEDYSSLLAKKRF